MEGRTWNGNETAKEEQNVSEQSAESRLRAAAGRIALDGAARECIIDGVKQRTHGRKKLAFRVPAAVAVACLFFSLLFLTRPGLIGEDVVVYAATEENGWQKLVEGERILLKMEPFESVGEGGDIEAFDETGRCTYYPYICTFRLEVPENYLYDRQFTTLRDDYIGESGGKIIWQVAPDRPEDAGRIMQEELSLWIVNENRERMAALKLELTKEDGKCYAELKRVWESEAYKRGRHKN